MRLRRPALMRGLVLAAVLLASVLAGPTVADERRVFAHYMLHYNVFGDGVEDFAREIELALAAGIDGFALNFANHHRVAGGEFHRDAAGAKTLGPNTHRKITNLFTAAARVKARTGEPFGLFFSYDFLGRLNPTPAEIADYLGRFVDDPHYFRHGGRPLLSAYRGDRPAPAFWREVRRAFAERRPDERLLLVPDLRRPLESYDRYAPVVDGVFDFTHLRCPRPPDCTGGRDTLSRARFLAARTDADDKLYMAGVAPAFWMKCKPRRHTAFTDYRGPLQYIDKWESIIFLEKPDFVEIVTWNDYGEDTFVFPEEPMRFPGRWERENRGWVADGIPNLPKRAFHDLTRFFAGWYKTGAKPRVPERLLAFYYLEDLETPPDYAAARDVCTTPNPETWGPMRNLVSVVTLLDEPHDLRVAFAGIPAGARTSLVAAGAVPAAGVRTVERTVGTCGRPSCLDLHRFELAPDEQVLPTVRLENRRTGAVTELELVTKAAVMDPELPNFNMMTLSAPVR